MTVTLNITAESLEEIQHAVAGLMARVDCPEKIPTENVKNSDQEPETLATPEKLNAPNPGKFPPADVKKSDLVPAVTSEITDVPVENIPEPVVQEEPDELDADMRPVKNLPTMEETRAVLNDLRKKHGAKAVRGVLAQFSVTSFTEIDPNEYPAVIEAAKEAMGKDE